ncbi:PepSY-associated TM helix domain-containing protein [Sphingomonas sp. BAUL-RG-20F-R05-02]|uniref:PepSY-associated TM helix domain-containing protein n=1 Tax=Sphingomonas sp. BAUL-RG-20F-R05-02 TaxID=2914830 RepID=UPI001F573777|nr:PepSY-associated TM helix domain-containing protein [Sphingomonas sp. BAUL-RG-20F-R05-02]
MNRLHDGARQTMAWLHGWTGLLLGHVLYLMAFAGTLSMFKPEISRWMRPENTAQVDSVRAITAATDWLSHNAADAPAWYLTAPDARTNTIDAYFTQGGKIVLRALDPTTGAPVLRETLGGEFFYRLHFELELPYPWGRTLASLAAATMLIALISGIVAHRRFFRDFFTFRADKGQRSWLDAHNVLGVFALPFHLMITLTGILTLLSLSMPWPGVSGYGADMPAMFHELAPGGVDRPAAGRHARLGAVADMMRDAQVRCGGAVGRVTILNPGDAAAVASFTCADAAQIATNAGVASYDAVSGRLLNAWIEHRPAITAYSWLYGLHVARFAPLPLRWLYFFGGAMLTLAIATGLILWTVKRRDRLPDHANRLLARVNAGVIVGVPAGALALLWANRLLPLGSGGRAGAEVTAALATAGVVLVVTSALPERLRWPLPFAGLAAGLIVLPFLGGWIGDGDAVLVAGNLLLLAAGALCAWLAWRSARC